MESNEFLEIINSRRNQNRKEYEIEFRYISEIYPIQNLETITYENALIFFSNKIKFRPNQIKFFIQKIPLLEKRTLLESIEDCIRKLSEKDKKISKNHYIIDIKVDSDISKQRRRRQEQEQREQEEKRRREEEERKRREKEERERDKEKRVYCGYVCKSCHYSCTLQKGHKGLHSVQHGNMRYSTLVTEKGKNGIESEEYHLKTGESSKQIICTHQCLLGGRGHIHLIPLDEINLNKVPQSFRKLIRYSDKEYSDNVQYYEATCHFYWNFYLKFKSGFSKEQEFEFSRCGAICGAEIHENHQSHSHEKKLKQVHALEFLGRKTENEEIPYCVLPLWHSKWIPNQFPKGYQQGFTSREGHFFPCNHGREFDFENYHHYLLIDRSVSMSNSDFQPEIYDWIKKKNNNRFGAVLECCINYLDLRIHENPEDLCTFITFDTSAEYIFESKKVNPNLIEEFGSNLDIGGGTYFYTGFELAFKLIKDENEKFKREKSVIVLLTDGGDCNSTKTKKLLEEQLQNFPEVLIHTVGFGEAGNSQDFLKEIAQMGKGDFHLAKDNIELGKAFKLIAKEPNKGAFVIQKKEF